MDNETTTTSAARLTIVAGICSAYLGNNSVSVEKVPDFIRSVSGVMGEIAAAIDGPGPAPVEVKPVPAVPVNKSITNDYIVCLEDGKKFKSLKRHLMTKFGLTPAAYRDRFGLPTDYPMVAKSYSEARSALAKSAGLGRVKDPAPKKARVSRKKAA